MFPKINKEDCECIDEEEWHVEEGCYAEKDCDSKCASFGGYDKKYEMLEILEQTAEMRTFGDGLETVISLLLRKIEECVISDIGNMEIMEIARYYTRLVDIDDRFDGTYCIDGLLENMRFEYTRKVVERYGD